MNSPPFSYNQPHTQSYYPPQPLSTQLPPLNPFQQWPPPKPPNQPLSYSYYPSYTHFQQPPQWPTPQPPPEPPPEPYYSYTQPCYSPYPPYNQPPIQPYYLHSQQPLIPPSQSPSQQPQSHISYPPSQVTSQVTSHPSSTDLFFEIRNLVLKLKDDLVKKSSYPVTSVSTSQTILEAIKSEHKEKKSTLSPSSAVEAQPTTTTFFTEKPSGTTISPPLLPWKSPSSLPQENRREKSHSSKVYTDLGRQGFYEQEIQHHRVPPPLPPWKPPPLPPQENEREKYHSSRVHTDLVRQAFSEHGTDYHHVWPQMPLCPPQALSYPPPKITSGKEYERETENTVFFESSHCVNDLFKKRERNFGSENFCEHEGIFPEKNGLLKNGVFPINPTLHSLELPPLIRLDPMVSIIHPLQVMDCLDYITNTDRMSFISEPLMKLYPMVSRKDPLKVDNNVVFTFDLLSQQSWPFDPGPLGITPAHFDMSNDKGHEPLYDVVHHVLGTLACHVDIPQRLVRVPNIPQSVHGLQLSKYPLYNVVLHVLLCAHSFPGIFPKHVLQKPILWAPAPNNYHGENWNKFIYFSENTIANFFVEESGDRPLLFRPTMESNLEDKVDFKGVGNDRMLDIIFVMKFIREGIG